MKPNSDSHSLLQVPFQRIHMTPLTKSRPTQLQHLQHFKATAPLASGAAVVVPAGCEEVAFKPESANSVGVVTAEASVGLGLAPVSVAELEEKEEGGRVLMTRDVGR